MTLISLLIVLMLEHFFKVSSVLEMDFKSQDWFLRWHQWIATKFHYHWFENWSGIAIIIGIPVLFVYLISDLDSGFIFWLLQLALTILVLAYCLGPIEQNEHLRKYFDAVDREDLQSAYEHIVGCLNLKSGKSEPEDIQSLGRMVTRLILSQSNYRYFAVLMYFVLLGPAGALLYRLTHTFEFSVRDVESSPFRDKLIKLRKTLDWLPARLTGFLYSLAGDFTGAISKLKEYMLQDDEQNEHLLEETGLGALGVKSDVCTNIIDENNEALALVSRSVVVLIVFIAILTVFGWLS